MPEVLVVEDDAALRATVARALRSHDLDVTTADDGASALAAAGQGPGTRFAAVVLDIGLPDSDGRDVCHALRARGMDVPVLFLTARDQLHDLLSGYAAGGDEYLTKPFHVRELLVRLDVLLRHAARRPPPAPEVLQVDPVGHSLDGPTGRQPLTPTEFRLLAALMAATGNVVRRRELARAGWPDGAIVADNTLDQYVARLRRKLRAAGDHGRTIGTVVGVGYRFQ
ncbi:MAG TPA: response regulator transcription factor [Modestobacter sp.]|nr:response regulator transcription factor [Modestobacter sp.]